MGRLIRLVLLQCFLAFGLATASPLLSAALQHGAVAVHCPDCPPHDNPLPAEDCCIQHSQHCNGCTGIIRQSALPVAPTRQATFAEPPQSRQSPVFPPLKPPPRTVLNT